MVGEDSVPAGARITADIRIVQYLTSEGETAFAVAYEMDVQRSTLVGLLEIARHDLLHRSEL